MYTARSAEAVSINDIQEFNPFNADETEQDIRATVISDAFEAVTNGMYNPEAIQKLKELGSDPVIRQWYDLVKAIESFYKQNFRLMADYLDKITDDSLPGSLKPILNYMSGLSKLGRKPTFLEDKLIRRITEDSRFLSSAISQLNDSIEYGGELFTETVSLLIKEIKVSNPESAERLALWGFNICFKKQFDEEPLADNILMIFGQAEGLRLIALSLIEEDPESSLICFTRSMIKKLDGNGMGKEEAIAWLDIIEALISECGAEDPVFTDISELLSMLETEITVRFCLIKAEASASDPIQKITMMKRLLSQNCMDNENMNEQQAVSIADSGHKKAVQLELF